jgi:23S rRNA (guanosine2251-2'-O)-methyltransferase
MSDAVVGFHAIEELLKSGKRRGVLYVSAGGSRRQELEQLARRRGYAVRRVPERELEEYVRGSRKEHRGAVFLAERDKGPVRDLQSFLDHQDRPGTLVLALDGITDPHNLGAILRSAEQFGVDVVVLPARRSARVNPTVEKVSAGASNYVRTVTVTNLRRALGQLKEAGYWVYGADAAGAPLWDAELQGKTVLVMGSEGKGVSEVVRRECDQLLRIPTSGRVDSLNVSVAAGVLLYECYRRQRS